MAPKREFRRDRTAILSRSLAAKREDEGAPVRNKDRQFLRQSQETLEHFKKNVHLSGRNLENWKEAIRQARCQCPVAVGKVKPAVFLIEKDVAHCCWEDCSKKQKCSHQFNFYKSTHKASWNTFQRHWNLHLTKRKNPFCKLTSIFFIKSERNVVIANSVLFEEHLDKLSAVKYDREIGEVAREVLESARLDLRKVKKSMFTKEFNARIPGLLNFMEEIDDERVITCQNGFEFKKICRDRVKKSQWNEVILVREKTGLGMIVPPKGFGLRHFAELYGLKELVPVVDSNRDGHANRMVFSDFMERFENPQTDEVLNILSLEFSNKKKLLEEFQLPLFVMEHSMKIKLQQNGCKTKQMEKTEHYFIVTMAGAYTDYHIDFGGTSVYFYLFEGWKTFLLVPPTKENLRLFQEYLNSHNDDRTFGEYPGITVIRKDVRGGETLFMPSGWIHAVYTHENSTGYSGSFLNQANLNMQLQILEIEEKTRTNKLYRMKSCELIHWLYLEHILLKQVADCNNRRVAMAMQRGEVPHTWIAFRILMKKLKIGQRLSQATKLKRQRLLDECNQQLNTQAMLSGQQ